MYFISIGILTPLAKAYAHASGGLTSPRSDDEAEEPLLCSVMHLRAVNLVLSLVTMLIINKLTHQIHGNKHVSPKVT